MKIALINDQPLFSGMGKYGYNLYQYLKNREGFSYLYLDYSARKIKEFKNDKILDRYKTIKIPIIDNRPFFWWRIKNHLPPYDIYHFCNQNLSFMISKKINIVTCHDIAPLLCPINFLKLQTRKFLYSGLKRANLIISDSYATKYDLIKAYQIAETKIKVIHLGVDHSIYYPQNDKNLRGKLGLPEDGKLLLHVGVEKWHKNIPNILKALSLLISQMGKVYLIRIGKKSKESERLINSLNLSEWVIYRIGLSEEELAKHYNACDVLIFPSFYEGFGLPILEALACGLPVVVSNTTSLPEIGNQAAIYCSPLDYYDIAEKIKTVLADEDLRSKLTEEGVKQSKNFTWERCGEEVWRLYQEIYCQF